MKSVKSQHEYDDIENNDDDNNNWTEDCHGTEDEEEEKNQYKMERTLNTERRRHKVQISVHETIWRELTVCLLRI